MSSIDFVFSRVGHDRHRLLMGQRISENMFQPTVGIWYFALANLQKLQRDLTKLGSLQDVPDRIGQMVIQLYRYATETYPSEMCLALTEPQRTAFVQALADYLLLASTAPIDPDVSFGPEEITS